MQVLRIEVSIQCKLDDDEDPGDYLDRLSGWIQELDGVVSAIPVVK